MSDVFRARGPFHPFAPNSEFGVPGGANLAVDGDGFSLTFSTLIRIEECLNSPLLYQRSFGCNTAEVFSEAEIFNFPEGIGVLERVRVEHEVAARIPPCFDAEKLILNYCPREELISFLRTPRKLNFEPASEIKFGKVLAIPHDVAAMVLASLTSLAPPTRWQSCAGIPAGGISQSVQRCSVDLLHVLDKKETVTTWGSPAVVGRIALNSVSPRSSLLMFAGIAQASSVPSFSTPLALWNNCGDAVHPREYARRNPMG